MADEKSDRFALPLLASGQAQKEITHNEALTLIDVLLHPQVQSLSLVTPPALVEAGQSWIVGSGATDAWLGQDGMIAARTAGGWRFIAPRKNMQIAVEDEALNFRYDGSEWVPVPARPDGFYVEGIRIIGAQSGPVEEPDGGTVVDTEAREALNQLLATLRSHGLIAEY